MTTPLTLHYKIIRLSWNDADTMSKVLATKLEDGTFTPISTSALPDELVILAKRAFIK